MAVIRAVWDSKKPAILTALRKSKNKEVQHILGVLEDCDPGQEKGIFNKPHLVLTVVIIEGP